MVYSNVDDNVQRYYFPKSVIKNYYVIINKTNFYHQLSDSGINQYQKTKKTATDHKEHYTTGCLLHYDYIKNHYRLIAVYLSRQKELDTNPRAIQQIELIGQFIKPDDNDNTIGADNDQSMFSQGSLMML